jgi:hypothetical protein
MRPKPLDHAWTSNLDVALTARADAVLVRRYRSVARGRGIGLPGDREAVQTQINMRRAERDTWRARHGTRDIADEAAVVPNRPRRRNESADVFRQHPDGPTQERDRDESAGSTPSDGSHEHFLSKGLIIRR